jgi:hypothetical protein
VVTGDTDGDTTTDEFVAFNGLIGVREGDLVDGIAIPVDATVRAASINDRNEVVHIWGRGLADAEYLFFGLGPSLQNSVAILSVGDEIDVGTDGIADYAVTDFRPSSFVGPGLDLAEDGAVYVGVLIVPVTGGAEVDAILRLEAPKTGDTDVDGDLDLYDFWKLQQCFAPSGPVLPGCEPLDFDNDEDIDLGDYDRFAAGVSGPVG